jgi:hypothetical protein
MPIDSLYTGIRIYGNYAQRICVDGGNGIAVSIPARISQDDRQAAQRAIQRLRESCCGNVAREDRPYRRMTRIGCPAHAFVAHQVGVP